MVRVNPSTEPAAWQRELADAVRDPDELRRLLALPADSRAGAALAQRSFPLLVPRAYVARMRRGDADDPLLAQVLPAAAEAIAASGYGPDPLRESGCAPTPGLLRKYHGRALIVATGACAVHCRYCFRRHFPYQELPRGHDWWRPALAHIAADPSVEEVILSGGDPLVLPDAQLAGLVAGIADISHVARLRIHTRLPVVLPRRIDDRLVAWMRATRLPIVVVIHANHPREIDDAVAAACARLRGTGATVLNQSVLLRGVNDSAEILGELSQRLFRAGALPYYLHALDRVQGAAHFAVGDDEARELMRAVAARLPGYLVPRLVRETPDEPMKTPIGW